MTNSSCMTDFVEMHHGDGPIVAVAIHDGHCVREELVDQFALAPAERMREEDPYTGSWTEIAPTQVIGLRSRFEVDLNRKRHRAVYLGPRDAWGLNVWKQVPDENLVEQSRLLYDEFYRYMFDLLSDIQSRYGTFFVYDLHAYNHRREGPGQVPASAVDNPQINVCTGGMDLQRCEPIVQCFVDTLRSFDFLGGKLDVRRNVRFRATRFSRWVHENFPGSGISIGIEVKKFFMDEWTGELDLRKHAAIGSALGATVEPLTDLLLRLERERRLA